jgi:antimicrobial peptide system SdpB family protein
VSWASRASTFEPRSTALAVGRSLVALAELVVVVFTPDSDLFGAGPGRSLGPSCGGLRGISLWCIGPGPGSGAVALALCRGVAVAALLLVASGYRPRWTCIPHWYLAFSIGLAGHVGNGGEQVARLLTLLLIPVCLGDARTWQWQRPEVPISPVWRGAAYAGHLAIRAQVAVIYGTAAVTKLREPQWRHGTAMHYIFQNAYFGAPPALLRFLERWPPGEWAIMAITWGTIVVEVFIVVSAFAGPVVRRRALAAGVALHGGIIAALGLASFGLVMIGLLATASSGRFRSSGPPDAERGRPSAHRLNSGTPTARASSPIAAAPAECGRPSAHHLSGGTPTRQGPSGPSGASG